MLLTRVVSCCAREQFYKSPKTLYKHLIRECAKLPKDAGKFYKFSIQQSFKQHVNEPDPERVKSIIDKTLKDTEWILNKYAGKGKT